MGGWVSDLETWDRFTEDWDKALRKSPSIAYFKHKEAKSKSGQFSRWSEVDANSKILALAHVIDKHIDPKIGHYGIVTGMKPEVLRILLRRSPATGRQIKSVVKLTSSYDFCFHAVAGMVLTFQHYGLRNSQIVDFVFDANPLFANCADTYRELKKRMPADLAAIAGTATDGDDKHIAPLQAADLLVGQVTTNLKDGKPDKPFQLLNRVRRILFSPIRWGEDAALTGFATTLEIFNVYWSSLMIQKASK
jgi:hypothetical protein